MIRYLGQIFNNGRIMKFRIMIMKYDYMIKYERGNNSYFVRGIKIKNYELIY